MKKTLIISLSFFATVVYGQLGQNVPSIHEEQLNYYNSLGNADAAFYEAQPQEQVGFEKTNCNLNKVVYGWHPYWVGSAYQNYQWDLLSHLSFFSYEVNASDGQPITTHGWSTSAAVDAALASGNTKVTLCVTLFSGHATFFSSSTAQQTLITNLINLVQSRGAHGVNIDFEGLPSLETVNFSNFMVDLANQMHSAIPGSEVSTVLYAVDWNNVFNFNLLEPAVDQYIIMGYGYYYNGSANAGPTDPLYHFGTTYNYTLSKTITSYLDKGCPADKLVLGLPSYGYEWETSSTGIPSSTMASGSAKTYAVIKNNQSGNYSAANHNWVTDPLSDAYVFNDGSTKQCFISLDSAWRKRLDHVNKTGIAGIGIWALGYDNGYTDLWSAMNDYLTVCYEDPCSGIIHDFGGPTKNYYNDEDYTWTIAPPGASTIDVDFTEFDVELNYDYLYIYDGPDDQAPQIVGSPFTGTTGPGQFSSSTGALTFKFTSDGATVTPGFYATYQCSTVPQPQASFSLGATTICQGDSILLSNLSTNGDTYQWSTSSGGLSSSSAFEPYLFPSSSGNYTITLDVANNSGTDQTSQQFLIIIEQPPVASATSADTNITIPGEVAYFTNSSANATNYLWDFGDGTTSGDTHPWHEYTSNGVYTVMLIASNSVCENDTAFIEMNVGAQGIGEGMLNRCIIYPNPTKDLVYLESPEPMNRIILFDSKGKIILDQIIENNLVADLSLFGIADGHYKIKVYMNSGEEFISSIILEQ